MKIWLDIPNEILGNIFRYLEQKELGQSSLTCRAWRSVALPVLFENLDTSKGESLCKLLEALTTATTCKSDYQSLGNLVKTLKFSFKRYDMDIAQLDQVFPSLQYIYFEAKFHGVLEKGCICKRRKELFRILVEGKFPNLKKMPSAELDTDLLKLLLTRKEHIKELELKNLRFNHLTDVLVKILPLFHELETLNLEFDRGEGGAIFLENLLPEVPSALKSINFDFRFGNTIVNLNASDIQPLPAVREVTVSYFPSTSFGEKEYLYVMKKFPKAEILEFENIFEDIHNYTVPSVESTLHFLKYLFNIRRSSSSPAIITNKFTAEVVHTFFDYVLGQRLSSTTFKNLEIHLELHFNIKIYDELGDANVENCTTCIIPKNQCCGTNKLCEVEVLYNMVSDSNRQPYLELFQKIGNMHIESLRIDNSDRFYCGSQEILIPFSMIVKHFINVKKLVIFMMNYSTFAEELSSVGDKPKPNLECLEFSFCALKQHMFPTLVELCPNLKVLKLFGNGFPTSPRTDHPPTFFRIIDINLPSTILEELHFAIAINPETLYKYRLYKKAVIKFEIYECETKYYEVTLEDTDKFQDDVDYHQCSETLYENCLGDESCLVYNIYCHSRVKLFFDEDIIFPSI